MVQVQLLQRLCIENIIKHWTYFTSLKDFTLPKHFLIDFLECCVENKEIPIIHQVLLNPQLLLDLVETKDYDVNLYTSTRLLVDNNIPIHNEISKMFIQEKTSGTIQGGKKDSSRLIKVCEFLIDCGWHKAAGELLNHLYQTMNPLSERHNVLVVLTHLISTHIAECKFTKAKEAFVKASTFYDTSKDKRFNAGLLYAEEAYRHYCLSNFAEADDWADRALLEVNENLNTASCITVLRRTAKVYINTRRFTCAEVLIKHAVELAGSLYGSNHPLYADTLQDYGFCLLHLDLVSQCVEVYMKAVDIIDKVFGENNIKTAVAHEDLAYATYVYDYNYGNYEKSLAHSNISVRIVNKLLDPDHLLHASTSRLRALILEELAFDETSSRKKERLLREAQELHNKSLKLCRSVLGEDNIQTAKHYGNLGRLYQSMKMYKPAEKMHRRAIKIKESLLGPDNFELALSLGHLASLYNYDMRRFDDALPLYLRSIDIALKMFGPAFSGLEYDYRGLIYLYTATNQSDECMKYLIKLQDWIDLRQTGSANPTPGSSLTSAAHSGQSTKQVLKAVFVEETQ
ncbi:amyloid protein-binding protein 2-like [Bolinopsis microptera]|uniref:amyloid protein-binding protein 2-like n=1 Tax=Bolinopsis microptera TaxID=2820187 RepID=UPI003079375A